MELTMKTRGFEVVKSIKIKESICLEDNPG